MMKRMPTAILLLILTNLLACEGFGQTVEIGEQFTLKTKKSAMVRGTGIEVILNRIGRKWGSTPKAGESLDLSFSVKQDGKVRTFSEAKPVSAGKYKVEIIKTEPFGEGYVIFVVNKNDSNETTAAAAEFVEKFGWHLDESIEPKKTPLKFRDSFDGLPFYHYQSASQRSGVDMTPLLGKETEVWTFTLREKQKSHGAEFTVYANLIIENGKVAGAWRTDSSPSAPGIYSFEKR